MLLDLLSEEFIKLNVLVSNWKEAIEEGVYLLESKGYVENSYLKAIFRGFKKEGPYMVIAPGMVLAHGRPKDGVNKIGMSLVTLKEPINFGSKENDPVKLIITFSAIDNNSHLEALSQLMDLLMNVADVKRIFKATHKNEVINILKKYSK